MNPQSGYLEPLVALYSASDLDNLKSFLVHGNQSLRHFLGQVNCLVLHMSPGDSLTSIDNPVDAEKFKSQISNK
jgi:molybdopterin-guanine dinucleotide biosynthesis protein A